MVVLFQEGEADAESWVLGARVAGASQLRTQGCICSVCDG